MPPLKISTTFRTSPTAFPRRLGGFQVNPDAVLERRNDPAISSNADPLDIGHLAHVRRGLFDVAPLARHSTEGDLAGLGSHICREHFCLLRNGETPHTHDAARIRRISGRMAFQYQMNLSLLRLPEVGIGRNRVDPYRALKKKCDSLPQL